METRLFGELRRRAQHDTPQNGSTPEKGAELADPLLIAIQLSPVPTLLLSTDNLSVVYANPAAAVFLAHDAKQLIGSSLRGFVAERERAACDQLARQIAAGDVDEGIVWISDGQGVEQARLFLRKVGELVVAVDQRSERGDSYQLADTDALTGIPNRRLILRQIEQSFDRKDRHWGILFIDLNHYKRVNDQYGHVRGDAVLVEFAAKLRASVRPGDTVARYGGDEFIVLVRRVPTIVELRAMATRLSCELQVYVDEAIRVTASIGCAMPSGTIPDSATLIELADRDMYAVKRESASSRA